MSFGRDFKEYRAETPLADVITVENVGWAIDHRKPRDVPRKSADPFDLITFQEQRDSGGRVGMWADYGERLIAIDQSSTAVRGLHLRMLTHR